MQSIGAALARLGVDDFDIESVLEVPPQPELGDFAFPCFQLAKRLRKAPPQIANEVKTALPSTPGIARVETVHAYVNFFLDPRETVCQVTEHILSLGDRYGSQEVGRSRRVVLDYSAPNIAKPFHIGHLRSTIIGHSLSRIFTKLGYETVRINHLGDWGTQFGKLIVAYRLWGDDDELNEAPIETLNRLYVRFHEEAERDPTLEERARAAFKALEDGEEEETRIWRWFRDLSLVEFNQLYARLGVEFDSDLGESAYNDAMERVVARLSEEGLLKESEGALLVELDEMPPCLIKKKDGATLYATRDLAAAIRRYEMYQFDHLFYVVGMPQQLHFKQVFAVLEKMGMPWVNRCEHIPFGHIRLGEQQLSTRRGHVVYLDDLLDQAVARVRAIIRERNPELAEADEVAEQVGVGAVIFNDLFHNRIKDISFDWETALNFEGDTGPYVQYTHARAAALLRRAGVDHAGSPGNLSPDAFPDVESFNLAKSLAEYPEVILRAADAREPSEIARYLVALCRHFNSFYHARRIIGEPYAEERLALVAACKSVIAGGLYLLGIHAPDAM